MVVPSNIVTLEKSVNNTTNYSYTTVDTDGDGLEDGYEIWDFNTKWNEKDNAGNYILDSDGDGFPDGYEVLYQGTNPAVAENFTQDSDKDGLSDIDEYYQGTDPNLTDSDFDGISDKNDQGSTNPRKTDNPNINGTDQNIAYTSEVYMGPYDKEYSEVKDGVTYSYIKNIYSDKIKQVYIDYGDSSLNKRIKYFYDANGNNTAVIEQYDSEYDPSHKQTICVTYTYENDDIAFICDRATKYTMIYDEGKLKSFQIGNQEIANYNDILYVNRMEDNSSLDLGSLIKFGENRVSYGNGQEMKTMLYGYKRLDNDFSSTAYQTDIFQGNKASYNIEYNIEGKLLKVTDLSEGLDHIITYDYSYDNGNMTVTRNDGFTKEITRNESTDASSGTHTSTTTTKYTYKDLKGSTQTKSSTIVSKTDKDNNVSATVNMYSKDRYEYNADANSRVTIERIYSDASNKYAINSTKVVHDNSSVSQYVSSKNTDQNGDVYSDNRNYTYDLAGNITQIKKNDKLANEYSYDPHGRITEEKDYENRKNYLYEYDEVGNIFKKTTYSLDSSNNKISTSKSVTNYASENEQWPEQLTSYNGKSITYDQSGNPTKFYDDRTLTWTRGRLLKEISSTNNSKATYKYNENGYRTYKSTANSTNTAGVNTVYEWDENKLIRETNTDIATNKSYDIWYLYDDKGNLIGYDYIYLDESNTIKSQRVYYQKDIQGSIVGLLDEEGYWIARYSYNAWGNMIGRTVNQTQRSLVSVNHFGYKGYYEDDESGFWYTGKSYYVPELCRMLNPDEPENILEREKNIGKDQLSYNNYLYSNGNPISLPTDATGYDIDYEINQQVEVCETSSLLFESMKVFNTNCYGFAINFWRYKNDDNYYYGIDPGMFAGVEAFGINAGYIPCIDVANYVKQDFDYLQKDAQILTGKDNNPYYKTDEKHCLIAVRTMGEYNFTHSIKTDSYHFMVRKDDGWYFKSGWKVGILKLKEGYTPDTVIWTQYIYNTYTKNVEPFFSDNMNFYDSDIQYMVIPKMPLRIE